MILTCVAANKYYTFGVQAYRRVDPDVDAAEILKSDIVQTSESAEDPYQPSPSVAFAGAITGTIAGASDAGALETPDTVGGGDVVAGSRAYTALALTGPKWAPSVDRQRAGPGPTAMGTVLSWV